MDNRVYAIQCPSYDQVEEKMTELLEMMGGISQFVKSGEKILLKPNLLRAAEPEKMVTTHPTVVAAVGRIVKAQGAKPILADSPGSGYPYIKKTLKRIYHKSGMEEAAKVAGIELNFDVRYEAVSYPEGKLIKRFEVITPVLEADAVFNLCKLKTHSFTSMSGAVKNSFGVIPGLAKPGYHAKLHDTGCFASMLLDLSEYVSPRISIMDAVVGQEGNGPAAGTPRQVGFLLAAKNPLAMDVIAGEIMGIPRENNPILIEAEKRGLEPNHFDDVQLIGADVANLRIRDYKLPATIAKGSGFEIFPPFLMRFAENLLKNGASLKPHILREKCIACGTCRDACPVKVIRIADKKYAQIDHRNCIRCYCCHEMCPENAVELRSSLLYQILNR